jgi:hypothetical protein
MVIDLITPVGKTSECRANMDLWIYQWWDQVPKKSKHPL